MEYNEFIDWIRKRNSNIEEFSTSIEINNRKIAVSSDGVGTKLLVAKRLNKFDTIGIDLVAMNVNDLIASGYKPIGFSNYIACGSIKDYLKDIIIGIEEGCKLADCQLMGGETAILPDMYEENNLDLAGFAIGTFYRNFFKFRMKKGDLLYGVKSSGIHSNGLTIARKSLPISLWNELLIPTRIYTELLDEENILGMAHITGGGFSNIDRVIPDHLKTNINFDSWNFSYIFNQIIYRNKQILSFEKITKNLNLGIGMVLIIEEKFDKYFMKKGYVKIGQLEEK